MSRLSAEHSAKDNLMDNTLGYRGQGLEKVVN